MKRERITMAEEKSETPETFGEEDILAVSPFSHHGQREITG